MDEAELLARSMRFALRVTRFGVTLKRTFEGAHVRGQLFRAATSMAANYRSACRGRSRPDFISKLGVVEEESDEALFWLEFIQLGEFSSDRAELAALSSESRELLAIFTASHKTAKANHERSLRK